MEQEKTISLSPFTEKELIEKCQENPWIKAFGEMFREDPFAELDYQHCFTPCETLEKLKEYFMEGNWAIRQGFIYMNLCFIQQDNGGDEWWVVKKFPDGELIGFESISFRHIIIEGGIRYADRTVETFEDLIDRLLKASKEQCRKCDY